jgi:multicomponent Na+:H+ antiporter subunit E
LKSPRSAYTFLRQGGHWLMVYVGLWLLLGGASGWAVGLLFALAATGLSLWLRLPVPGLQLRRLPAFLGFFALEVLWGAWDVARRALHPRMPLDPAWVAHTLTCADPRVRLVLSGMVGLMPGTLSSHIENDALHLHVLDQTQAWRLPVERMETHLARLFGVSNA